MLNVSSRSLSEQRSLLLDKDNRRILERVKDDSSSLVVLLDPASLHSSMSGSTDRESLWSRAFDFDDDLLGSKVYKGQIRSLMKQLSGKRVDPQKTSNLILHRNYVEDELRKSQEPQENLVRVGDDLQEIQKGRANIIARIQHATDMQNKLQRSQKTQEILLLGPDNDARIMLLINMQNVFDPAGRSSRDKAVKDRIIRRHLPFICFGLYEHRGSLANLLSEPDWAYANLSKVYQCRDSYHLDNVRAQTVDALATLWKDERIKKVMTKTLRNSPVAWRNIDR